MCSAVCPGGTTRRSALMDRERRRRHPVAAKATVAAVRGKDVSATFSNAVASGRRPFGGASVAFYLSVGGSAAPVIVR